MRHTLDEASMLEILAAAESDIGGRAQPAACGYLPCRRTSETWLPSHGRRASISSRSHAVPATSSGAVSGPMQVQPGSRLAEHHRA
jgi:hypothetical protein